MSNNFAEFRVMYLGPASGNPRCWDTGNSLEWAQEQIRQARDVEQYKVAGERVTEWWIEGRQEIPQWKRIDFQLDMRPTPEDIREAAARVIIGGPGEWIGNGTQLLELVTTLIEALGPLLKAS